MHKLLCFHYYLLIGYLVKQMNAGAVLLTDCVFWFIIVPFLEIHDYSLNVVSNLISHFTFLLYKHI